MKHTLDECKKVGYASTSEKANWNELYSSYKKLGGNHFREYVDEWKKEMNQLPHQKGEQKMDIMSIIQSALSVIITGLITFATSKLIQLIN